MLQNKLQTLSGALVDVTNKAYHYYAPSNTKIPYLVWAENGEYSSIESNNHKSAQAIYGYIDYFTKKEFDSKIDDIQNALNNIENCYWTLSSVQYGDPISDDDNLIHYTWEWRLW